jgi:hypothetical protein
MPKIKLDDAEYNTEDLSERGHATLNSLQFLEIQLHKLKSEVAIYKTAQRVYLDTLKSEIKKSNIEPLSLTAKTKK